jgi:hypothetical protein
MKIKKVVKDINCQALPLMSSHLETRRQFRRAIYESFSYHRDRWLDSLDVFSCNDRAPATVELYLDLFFYR